MGIFLVGGESPW